MTIAPAPACMICTRFREDSSDPVTCEAFPTGIPEVIWLGAFVHTRAYDGDGGLRLEPREGFEVLGDGAVVGPGDLRWDATPAAI